MIATIVATALVTLFITFVIASFMGADIKGISMYSNIQDDPIKNKRADSLDILSIVAFILIFVTIITAVVADTVMKLGEKEEAQTDDNSSAHGSATLWAERDINSSGEFTIQQI